MLKALRGYHLGYQPVLGAFKTRSNSRDGEI